MKKTENMNPAFIDYVEFVINNRILDAMKDESKSCKVSVAAEIYPIIKSHLEARDYKVELDTSCYTNKYKGFFRRRKVGIKYLPVKDGTLSFTISWE